MGYVDREVNSNPDINLPHKPPNIYEITEHKLWPLIKFPLQALN